MDYNKIKYKDYIKSNIRNYLDIDINTLSNSGEVGFYLEYLDDYLLSDVNNSLDNKEKISLLTDFMKGLNDTDKEYFIEIFLQKKGISWDEVSWEITNLECGSIYLRISA